MTEKTKTDCDPKHWWESPRHKWGKWVKVKIMLTDNSIVDCQERTCEVCNKYQRELIRDKA